MKLPYIEQDCNITQGGTVYSGAGAVIDDQQIIAYPTADGVLGDWHGTPIGTWRSIASWKQPDTLMHQIEAVVAGLTYTGRGQGVGMIFTGKRKAGAKP